VERRVLGREKPCWGRGNLLKKKVWSGTEGAEEKPHGLEQRPSLIKKRQGGEGGVPVPIW